MEYNNIAKRQMLACSSVAGEREREDACKFRSAHKHGPHQMVRIVLHCHEIICSSSSSSSSSAHKDSQTFAPLFSLSLSYCLSVCVSLSVSLSVSLCVSRVCVCPSLPLSIIIIIPMQRDTKSFTSSFSFSSPHHHLFSLQHCTFHLAPFSLHHSPFGVDYTHY